jgi:3-oxoacyl-[acyl-carrier protein] reductase
VALRAAKGAVVNTASIGGLDVPGSSIAYSASKAGLINMTKNLARALSPEARVNAVAPGYVESAWTSEWPQTKKDAFVQKTLLRRACQPQDVAEVIVFLAADAAMVTGQTLVVDGGLTLA